MKKGDLVEVKKENDGSKGPGIIVYTQESFHANKNRDSFPSHMTIIQDGEIGMVTFCESPILHVYVMSLGAVVKTTTSYWEIVE